MNENVKVLISFGAAGGGFELAWALKNDLDEILGGGATYLDAVSLSSDPDTIYIWDNNNGIWKMSNLHWFAHYVEAMFKSKVMIFIVTREWLDSYYCWEEYSLFLQSNRIIPIFLVDYEAYHLLEQGGRRILRNIDGSELEQDLDLLYDYVGGSYHFMLSRSEETSDYVWIIEFIGGSIRYDYHTKYCLSSETRENLLSTIVNICLQQNDVET